ncbi:type VI secretion system-associated FHA domain protein TagH [Burkholderia sp. IDO3]|uniref:type VI secretion system-associated FHA domain protein TagH n=1 Tax=Burkholderia sp. IDO3 TaxID=1705310 RepID=UPI000BBAE596|nr:type VI secretion system-associated FHA domain protein TagH [Burkholderia sp. IDO3]AXK62517.1 type VI secretion system-associated FHA domain protein TagH [Burkholderia sp. IDO3]PCD63533.1 type VI secretion system-associated FHA domain protein TagH [Burkholderia sp. IDO3]
MQLIVIEHAGEPVESDSYDAVVFHPPGGTIGRATDNHLVLRDDTRQISRLQALLQVGDDACLLKNLSSVSTIEVNREPVGYAQERALNTGDIIRIGPYVLRAERDDDRAAPVVDMPAASGTNGDLRSAVPETAARAHGEKGAGNRLWGLLQERLVPRGKAVDADTRSGTAHRDAAQPASRAAHAAVAAAPSQRDLNQLSIDPLDLFAQSSPEIGAPDSASSTERGHAGRDAPSATQADHAPEWTQHVRVQPAAAHAEPQPADEPAPQAPRIPTPDELLNAFFEGAGLDTAAESHQWSAEQLYIAGQLLALFANGTVELLSSRSILKREVKAHMTMLLDRENNPLKLLPDGGAVLRQMFGLPLPGFMSPQSAVSDAFQDLHAHQIGMVAGMRAALMDLLTRFSPQRLRERDDAMRWYEKRVPALYKARMWDRYAATHRDTVFAIEDDFASVFGKAFLAAYDAEVESYRGSSRH